MSEQFIAATFSKETRQLMSLVMSSDNPFLFVFSKVSQAGDSA